MNKPYILHQTGNHYYADGAGWLSLKCMFNGGAVYHYEQARVVVDDDHYLILNDQQPYTILKEDAAAVESFCIFFPQAWAADTLQTATTPLDYLLDASLKSQPVDFYERLHPHGDAVTYYAQMIRKTLNMGQPDQIWLDQKLYDLLGAMLQTQYNIVQAAEQLPASRAATRQELYRRMHHARDTMHSDLGGAWSLEDLANVACLSPYHFLRAFKDVFGTTPHAYLTNLRLEKAQYLLRCTDIPITDICMEVGFSSLGSFSSLFKRQIGLSPRAFREEFGSGRF